MQAFTPVCAHSRMQCCTNPRRGDTYGLISDISATPPSACKCRNSLTRTFRRLIFAVVAFRYVNGKLSKVVKFLIKTKYTEHISEPSTLILTTEFPTCLQSIFPEKKISLEKVLRIFILRLYFYLFIIKFNL